MRKQSARFFKRFSSGFQTVSPHTRLLLVALIATVVLTSAPGAHEVITARPVAPAGESYRRVKNRLEEQFNHFEMVEVSVATPLGKSGGQSSSMRLDLGSGRQWNLQLKPSDPRSPRYSVRTVDGDGNQREIEPSPSLRFYSAKVAGDPDSDVRIAIEGERVTGYVLNRGTKLFVEPLVIFDPEADKSIHLIYTAEDSRVSHMDNHKSPMTKEREHGELLGPCDSCSPTGLQKTRAATVQPCMVADLSFALDYSMVTGFGSIEAAEARVLTILNMVNGRYADPDINITHELVELVVGTSSTSFGRNSDFDLAGFAAWANSSSGFQQSYAIAGMLFYDREGGTVGMAYVGGVCSENRRFNINKDFSSNAQRIVILVAHEMGHNWSAQHVDDRNCIMYPSVLNNNTQWCQATITSIVNHKNSRSCLYSCDVPPVARFKVNDTAACNGTKIFIDESVNNPQTWRWDFGDGTTSSDQNPLHSYSSNGNFQVTLTVTNDQGTDMKTKEMVINAPHVPTITGKSACNGGSFTMAADGDHTVKWYTVPQGGAPVHVGQSFVTPVLAEPTVYYVENSFPEESLQLVGPKDTTDQTGGGYQDRAHDVYMSFETHSPLIFRSITVYANRAGKRHLLLLSPPYLQAEKMLLTNIPEGKSVVTLNWRLAPNTPYRLYLENTSGGSGAAAEVYINNLYRSTDGVSYPQTIDGLVTVTGNYWRDTNPNTTGWYIGYNWIFQKVDPCASGRVAVAVDPAACNLLGVGLSQRNHPLVFLNRGQPGVVLESGQRAAVTIFDVQGRVVLEKSFEGNAGAGVQQVGVNNLSRGIYLIKLVVDRNRPVTNRFIHLR